MTDVAPDESAEEGTEFLLAARTGDFASKNTLGVVVAGREILICQTAEGCFAVDNICSHADAQLSLGRLRGTRIFCPLHGASFDVRDGKALSRPATRDLRSYPVRVEADEIYVDVRDE